MMLIEEVHSTQVNAVPNTLFGDGSCRFQALYWPRPAMPFTSLQRQSRRWRQVLPTLFLEHTDAVLMTNSGHVVITLPTVDLRF